MFHTELLIVGMLYPRMLFWQILSITKLYNTMKYTYKKNEKYNRLRVRYTKLYISSACKSASIRIHLCYTCTFLLICLHINTPQLTGLLLKHKAVNNTAPEYLCDLIRLNVKSTTIRTRASFDPCVLCVPPISKTCANSFFDRSFVYAPPTLWNALDLDIRLLPFDNFKKSVKTHLYLKYFVN